MIRKVSGWGDGGRMVFGWYADELGYETAWERFEGNREEYMAVVEFKLYTEFHGDCCKWFGARRAEEWSLWPDFRIGAGDCGLKQIWDI
jgi:hypothetical protein